MPLLEKPVLLHAFEAFQLPQPFHKKPHTEAVNKMAEPARLPLQVLSDQILEPHCCVLTSGSGDSLAKASSGLLILAFKGFQHDKGKAVPHSAAGQGLLNPYALENEAGIRDAEHILVAQRHRLHVGEGGGVPLRMDNCDWISLPCLIIQSTIIRIYRPPTMSNMAYQYSNVRPWIDFSGLLSDWHMNHQCKNSCMISGNKHLSLTIRQNNQTLKQVVICIIDHRFS